MTAPDEHPALTADVLDLLRRRGLTVATAESLTGGLVSSLLCEVPGASDVHLGGVVSYATAVKHRLLQVPPGPVISESTARSMATGVSRLVRADCAVATTGVAGPARQEGRPVGTVCVAALVPGTIASRPLHLPGDRGQVRTRAAMAGLALLGELLRHPRGARGSG